jgi:hypothetical protein
MSDTVDASIPLSGNTPSFDAGKFLEMTNLAQQMRQRQTDTQKQNALAGLLSDPQSYDPQGNLTPTALRSSNALSPQYAMQYRQQQIDAHLEKVKADALGDAQKLHALEFKGSVAAAAEKARQDKFDQGGTLAESLAAATEVRNRLFKESGGLIGGEELNWTLSQPYDQQGAAALKRFAPGEIAEERLAQQDKLGQERIDIQGKGEAEKERAAAEKERSDKAREDRLERIAASVAARGGKAPAGFEWDPQNPDMLRPIKGGPKDPNASNMSGRESVYFKRVTSSANEAAATIDNIVQLPVGASSGWAGVGASPGHSIFSSVKGVLTNKMSSDDVQDYNTMLPGIKRNLATIESAGLAPSGSLTENFSGLELREGDTQMTKLRKLAEMRQIIEKGIETNLDDPHVPEPQKDLVRRIIDQVSKSVPFTQNDITRLQRAQQQNPDMTLEQLIKNKGLGGNRSAANSSTASRAPASAARSDSGVKTVSSKAEYDRLPAGARYSKPDDPPGSYRVKQ